MPEQVERRVTVEKLSKRKESGLRLKAELTLEATLAAEEKLAKLAPKTRASTRVSAGTFKS